jgi:hypothetical protein
MVWKIRAAKFGLNDVPGLCVNSAHRPNSTEYFPLSVDMLDANARLNAFKLYFEEVNFNIF